jgi:curved DNA-binding protein CbpA
MPKPHELRRACEWLKIPVPTKEEPLDYDSTRKQYRLLLAQYHPDRNKNQRAVEMYRAICEAMETIERLRAIKGELSR